MGKNKPASTERQDAATEYYKLNVRAVEDLVTANEENSPKVSEEELRRYQSGPKVKMADWVKMLLMKTWFAGAVCFFFLWGLGFYIQNQLDQILVVSLAWGAVTDMLTNNAFRFLAKTPGANDRWMMFPRKGFISLPLNLLYGALVMICVVTTYHAINVALMFAMNTQEMALGVEPVLFGILTVAWDSLFIAMKHTIQRIGADAKRQALEGQNKKQP